VSEQDDSEFFSYAHHACRADDPSEHENLSEKSRTMIGFATPAVVVRVAGEAGAG